MEPQETMKNEELEGQLPADQQPAEDDGDFPLGQACDLSGEGTCEACQ